MKVKLGDIRPNPFRNIDRYPISREKVDKLKQSIERTEFWDNVVARPGGDGGPDSWVEIAYGHHRLVALRELYPPDHEVSLIVRDLTDAEMLHIMADENMQEWASSGEVIIETVRAVRDFLYPGPESRGGRPSDGTALVVEFLGWPEFRVREAIRIIEAEEVGTLTPEDTAGLSIKQAAEMRRHVARIPDPEVRKQAIARVRDDLQEERIGKRGIADVVREVRDAARPATARPVIAAKVAEGLWRDIDDFWRVGIRLNGEAPLRRDEIIRLIAANRNAQELQGVAGPWSDQIADALDQMAKIASDLSAVLRTADAVEVL